MEGALRGTLRHRITASVRSPEWHRMLPFNKLGEFATTLAKALSHVKQRACFAAFWWVVSAARTCLYLPDNYFLDPLRFETKFAAI